MHRFTTTRPPRLSIDLRAGAVRVDTADGHGGDAGATTVELVPMDTSSATADAIAAAVVEQRGDDIVVDVPHRAGGLVGRSPQVGVRITAPPESALRVRSGSADVAASGRFGATDVETGSGDVELGDVVASARVQTGSGTVRVHRVAEDLVVRTGSGAVVAGSVGGEASFTSGSGRLELAAGGRALHAKTGSGDITVGAAPGDVRVDTASGDVRIAAVSEGEVRVKAASGDIHAGIRTGTAAWLEVRTISGRVTSALESSGEPADGERRVRLRLRTASGDIELARV